MPEHHLYAEPTPSRWNPPSPSAPRYRAFGRDHAHITVLSSRKVGESPPPTFLFFLEARVSFERAISGRLAGAILSKDEIEKQIEENESLRFGSATFWNTFL
jgi:hypothetical protein